MVERKQYKTKLCLLYQRGRCSRQRCSFAHGSAELRRYSGSYHARRGYGGSDLRDKLDSRHPQKRRFSPVRDARDRKRIRGYSPIHSPSNSPGRNRKKHHLDGQSDFSESLRNSGGMEGKIMSADPKGAFEEQLKELQSDINALERNKFHLETYLEEKDQEVDSLSSRIKELEFQLREEKKECKRITSKIKKFVKAHNRCSRLQNELKRAQVRLQKFGDQLSLDTGRIGHDEEDSSINIVSDGEAAVCHTTVLQKKLHNDSSPRVKSFHAIEETSNKSKQAVFVRGGEHRAKAGVLENLTPRNASQWESDDCRELEAVKKGINSYEVLAEEGKHKLKVWDTGIPSTSMAAHAVDGVVEIELEDKVELVEAAATGNEKEATHEVKGLSFLVPPLPITRNNYSQYEDNDENVDVGGPEETADVDII